MSQDDLTLDVLPEGHWRVELVRGWTNEQILVRGERSDYAPCDWPEHADYLEVKAKEMRFRPKGRYPSDHEVHGRYSATKYALPVPGDLELNCQCLWGPLGNGLGIDGAFLGSYFQDLTPSQRLRILTRAKYHVLRAITRVVYIYVSDDRSNNGLTIDYNFYAGLTERYDMRKVPPDLDFIAWWDACLESSDGCPDYGFDFEPEVRGSRLNKVADTVEWASSVRQTIFGNEREPT